MLSCSVAQTGHQSELEQKSEVQEFLDIHKMSERFERAQIIAD